jgi:hypothetical protein
VEAVGSRDALITPLATSKINVVIDQTNGYVRLTLPMGKGGLARLAVSLFLLCWLGGWAVGWISTFRQLTSGVKAPEPFLIFWLAGWTIGGAFAFWYLWRLLRPTISETLVFAKPKVIYDTGVQPLPISLGYRPGRDQWRKIFEKRRRIEFTSAEIATLILRDTSESNRLTLDHATERIDVGRELTEVEREWLFRLVKQEYKI